MLSLNTCEISPWWVHCYKDPTFTHQSRKIIRLLLNVNRFGKKGCIFCYGKLNTIHHILLECPSVQTQRAVLWCKVINSCTKQFTDSLNCMPPREKCKFLLNAFNVKYVSEWKSMYDSVSNFIVQVLDHYHKTECSVQSMF